jgi:hypothetical protein
VVCIPFCASHSLKSPLPHLSLVRRTCSGRKNLNFCALRQPPLRARYASCKSCVIQASTFLSVTVHAVIVLM